MSNVHSITVCPDTLTLEKGNWYSAFCVTVLPEDATNKCVTWSSSNADVASVNPLTGYVYANETGSAVISATAADGSGVSGSCAITVRDPIPVQSITLNRGTLTLNKGCPYRLTAQICPENASNKKLTWSSSDTSVATVDQNGVITAKAGGTTTIYATAQDCGEVQGTCELTVKQTVVCCAEETHRKRAIGQKFATTVDLFNGAYAQTINLLSYAGGQELTLTARYSSVNLAVGDFGVGWYHDYEKHLDIKEDAILVYSTPSCYSKFEPEDECHTRYTCSAPNRSGCVLTVNHCLAYPYALSYNMDRTEFYDEDGNLAKIRNHQGYDTLITHTVAVTTITDAVTGKSIHLERDSTCNVVRIYDDYTREVFLTYEQDRLKRIVTVTGGTISFEYDGEGRIKSGTDANGTKWFDNTYDSYGRLCLQKDAIPGSRKCQFLYVSGIRQVTDRNGHSTQNRYNDDGMLVKTVDPLGAQTTYEYDDHYNLLKETGPDGCFTRTTYTDFNKPASVTNKNGYDTVYQYDASGNVIKILYPAINNETSEETFVYNDRNQVIRHTDRRGTVTVYTYDANGMPASRKVGDRNPILYNYQNGYLSSVTDAKGNTTSYTYTTGGQVATETDACGNVTSYQYDAAGHLLRVTDAKGHFVAYTYDAKGQKISATDQRGNTTTYSYNGNGKNDKITLPDGHCICYEYDGENRLTKVTDQAGNITTMQYDAAGRMISKHFPDGGTTTWEYDSLGRVTKEINAKGAEICKTYDAAGNVLTVKDDEGHITRFCYNAHAKKIRSENAVSGAIVYTYSLADDLLSETDPLGNTRTYTYDAFGNRLTETDARGNTTTYTYDANNNLLTVCNALNQTTTYTYDCKNRLVSVRDARGHITHYSYDVLGQRIAVTDARGNTCHTFYDAAGNVIKTTDAKGNPITEQTYNAMNLPTSVTDASGVTKTYTYNALGKMASETDPLGHAQQYLYDSCGRNTSVTDMLGNTSTMTYDCLGNTTRISGPLGGCTDYTYDDMGRLTSQSTASGGTITYTYNALNLKQSLQNARQQTREFYYDAKGRITGCITPEASISYIYDANDNILSVSDENGAIVRTYDALDRISSCTDTQGKTISYQYDAAGNLVLLTYPDNTTVTYTYDECNNLTSVTDWANRTTTYTYDINNRLISTVKPDGSVTTTSYDAKQRIVSTTERNASGAVISGFVYTYDNLSRIVDERVLANDTHLCYTYDSLSRVTKRTVKNACGTVLSEENYSYDAAGNVTDAPDACFVYGTNNRLTVYCGHEVTYDADGNMLSAYMNGRESVVNFYFDSGNRLITTCDCIHTYNAEDVRISTSRSGFVSSYTYDTNCHLSRLLVLTDSSGTTKYVYGLGLIGEEKNNSFLVYHFDYRGSTIAITDITGAVVATFTYDTYGKLLQRTGTVIPIFGYCGKDGVITDGDGLLYMRARYYCPEYRRFINADVVKGVLSNAITLNRYAYANGNPVSNVDPFGLEAEESESESSDDTYYYQAILVSNFSYGDESLPVVGHSQLYLRGDDGNWYLTQYLPETFDKNDLLGTKRSAKFWLEKETPPMYDSSTDSFINVEGCTYTVINGDFTKCIQKARSMIGDGAGVGEYNLLFFNCSDYTDILLDEAEPEGLFMPILFGLDFPISIPAVGVLATSLCQVADNIVKCIPNSLINIGERRGKDTPVGAFFYNVGSAINEAIDAVGGFLGEVTHTIVEGVKEVCNWVEDQATKLFNWFKSLF